MPISIDTKEITFGTATIRLIFFKNYKRGITLAMEHGTYGNTMVHGQGFSMTPLIERAFHRPHGDVLGNSGQEGVISIQRKGATI